MTTSTPAAPRHSPSRRSPRSSVPTAATALMTFGALIFASMAPPLAAAALDAGAIEALGLRGKNMVKDDAAADESFLKRECETCAVGVQCRSLQCSNLFQCAGSDGVADGVGCICAFDNDCSSGYCTLGLTCGEKIATGDTGCLENDDCLSGYCGILESLPPFECKASEGGQDLGSACITDAACASGSCGYSSWSCLRCCTGTMPPTPAPTAAPTTAAPTTAAPTTPLTPAPTAPLLDPGSGCLFDSQCASGNCGYSSWRCPSCCIEG